MTISVSNANNCGVSPVQFVIPPFGVPLPVPSTARIVKSNLTILNGQSKTMADFLNLFPAGSEITSIDADADVGAFLRVDGLTVGVDATDFNWNRDHNAPLFGDLTISALGGAVYVDVQGVIP